VNLAEDGDEPVSRSSLHERFAQNGYRGSYELLVSTTTCHPPCSQVTHRADFEIVRAADKSSLYTSHKSQRSMATLLPSSSNLRQVGDAGARIPMPPHPSHRGNSRNSW
jgi:hypothetical protein